MNIHIITLFPQMIAGFFEESIVKRAQEKKSVHIKLINLRDFAIDDYGTVDDRPYGGGAGMVMRADVVDAALRSIRFAGTHKTIITSPKGTLFTQKKAIEYSLLDDLLIFAGHYEEVDERAYGLFDERVSLGDFILTGGEIVAATIADAVVRLVPGVLKKEDAAKEESFFRVDIQEVMDAVGEDELLTKLSKKGVRKITLLEYPQYTRPERYRDQKVPDILLSGHTAKIRKWRIKQAYLLTRTTRKDLLKVL